MTDEKPLNELPERNVTDHFRDAIVIMAGIIPFPVSDILDRFLPSSLAKRQQEWQKRVAQGLVILQEQFNIMPETLTKNEVFTTALIEATWIAIRHHQEEQLEYFRNMVLNSALPDSPDDDIQKMFFRMVSDFTPWHIKLLEFFSQPDWSIELDYEDKDLEGLPLDLFDRIQKKFSELQGKSGFVTLAFSDLVKVRLITLGHRDLFHRVDGFTLNMITDFGHQFLKFVKSPLKDS